MLDALANEALLVAFDPALVCEEGQYTLRKRGGYWLIVVFEFTLHSLYGCEKLIIHLISWELHCRAKRCQSEAPLRRQQTSEPRWEDLARKQRALGERVHRTVECKAGGGHLVVNSKHLRPDIFREVGHWSGRCLG